LATLARSEAREVEQEYLACRSDVLAMLHAKFRHVGDHEELYQEAWTEALERQASGVEIENLPGLIKLIAWRRARDVLRNTSATPTDPNGALIGSLHDPAPTPDEYAQVHVDAAVIRRVVEELAPRQQAIIKLRFDLGLSGHEIQEVLGVTAKHLEKMVTRAYATVEQQLTADAHGETPWSRRQRSLLVACVLGLASEAQLARARRLLAEDPRARVLLRQVRATLDQVAVLLPVPVIADQQREQGLAVLDRLDHAIGQLRDGVNASALHASSASSSLEPAAGGLATLGAAGAAKVVLVCLSLGGGTLVCIQSGILDHHGARKPVAAKKHSPSHAKKVKTRIVPPAGAARPVSYQPKPAKTAVHQPRKRAAPVARATGPAPASPAPPGSQEFGPGQTGSSSAQTQPAAAPADGGGEFTP
jgi:RNA polymerase sigma factor (sigma-70 family)